jgi:outer membrane receptor protein involved in Fe transport
VGLTGTWRYYGEAELGVLGADGSLNNGGTRIDRYIDAYSYFDIAADWQVRDDLLLRVGVNNVLDSDPPLVAGVASNGNTFPELYDGLGRFGFVRLTANF